MRNIHLKQCISCQSNSRCKTRVNKNKIRSWSGFKWVNKRNHKDTKACQIINKLQDNIVDHKAENDKLRSDNIELKESMLHTEYIAKKKNLILNGIKDHPEMESKWRK